MFTANSMNCLTEALGLSLPGNGTVVATHSDRERLFLEAGRRIVDIARDIFMAVEAKRALLAAFESLMAGVTFLFVLSMALDDLARHDQRFDLGICWFGSDNC